MKFLNWFFLSLSLLSFKNSLNAQFYGFQEVPDSLIFKSYQSLYTDYYNSIANLEVNRIYATAFLKKAYINKDTLNITNGYYMITYVTDESNLFLNDSLLKYSAFLSEREANSFAWYAYQGVGGYYFDRRNFKKSFDNHIKALRSAKLANNPELENISTTNLGLLKERTGKYKEALADFVKNYNYELEKFNSLDKVDSVSLKPFLSAITLLANSYRLNKQYDSAQYFNRKVFKYQRYEGVERYIGNAGVNSAEVNFILGNYNRVIDSLNHVFPILIKQNNIPNIAVAYYLRGMANSDINSELAIEDLIRMDSIFNINNDLQPSLRPGYLHLVNFYKKKGDLEKQLYFIEQLVKFDSIVHDYKMYVSEGIYQNERKNLLNDQKNLKSEIDKSFINNKIILFSSISIVLLLVIEISRRRKQNRKTLEKYQLRFDDLIINTNSKQNINNATSEIVLSESLIEEIVFKLESFQLNKGFLIKDISANKLAKELGTNPNYLGQVIKHQFGKSFRQYLNDLRINYALQEIRRNPKMVNYSIQAIANESGYNNAEPFSKAFKAKTGYYPSEFISNIKNEESANSGS
tara:strand:- start:4416 stop:6149 length:1734 start_codon:yes stop_codon:yes gene_type:complete